MDHEARTSHDVLERMMLDESTEPTSLPLSLLQYVTNRFSLDHQIGVGGFAVVYKGIVGNRIVAVKKLSNTFSLHESKFHEEINCLIKAKHKNVIRFLGYCAQTQGEMENYEGKLVMADQRNWLLCFEYACNGSLDKHITDATCGLNWRERYRIISGICEGLLFLHDMRILHLDLKPANILLDGHMEPKIADFGLSRFLGEDQTRAITENLRGTLGYMDPEYLRSGQIGFASDIYSLGVIIMEILTGVKRYLEDDYVVESWINRLNGSEGGMQLEQVRVCSKIGMECMNPDPKKRPVARHIIDRLDKTSSVDYSYETGISSSLAVLQVSLQRDQSGEGIGEPAVKSFQEVHVKEHSEISEDSLWAARETRKNADRHGTSIFGSIPTVFKKLNNLDIFNRKSHMDLKRKNMSLIGKSGVKIFSMKDLKPILKSENLIGKGSHAEVYKGLVYSELVAVKVFSDTLIEESQFRNEVIIQSQVRHKNVVRLIGCCLEEDDHMLVYEFIPRGSLDNILHGDKLPFCLDVRLAIVAESAQGLAYMHSQGHAIILHGDLKPANILFDEHFSPKIANFGISRFAAWDDQKASDMSYMDPIYRQTGYLTTKSDVYSFGIVILEVITRKKAIPSNNHNLVTSFLEVHKEGKKATDLLDKEIAVTAGDLEILDSLAEIVVECLNLDVDKRPTMTDIVERLLILNRSRRLQVV